MEQRERIDPSFRPLLDKFGTQTLRSLSGTLYGTWPDLRLAYLGPGWFSFARGNGCGTDFDSAWGLSSSLLAGIAPPLREFYESGLVECLRSGESWEHEYECSSDSAYRRYHQKAYPLGASEGLLITNSLVVERPHSADRRAHAPDELAYVDENGFIAQCSHCRRVKNLSELERWDWVPEWVRQPRADVSHTLCPLCFGAYYPQRSHG